MRTVSSEHHEAVQLQLVIVLFHRGNFIETVFIRIMNGLEGHAACAEDRAAARQDASIRKRL